MYGATGQDAFCFPFTFSREGDDLMAKAGMRRPDPREPHGTEGGIAYHRDKNKAPPVPELQGRAKRGKERAKPVQADTGG